MIWIAASAPVNSSGNPAASMNRIGGAMIAPSIGWVRNPDTQSSVSVEWWTAWKRHRNGISWLHRWAQ